MMEDRKYRNANSLILLIAACIPFIQLGITYYISISFLLFLFAFVYTSGKFFNTLTVNQCIVALAAVFFFKMATLAYASAEYRAILLPAREMLCAFGIVLISAYIADNKLSGEQIGRAVIGFLCVILLLVCVQVYFLSRGQYFGLPIEYFIMNQETLTKAEDALYYGSRYRATAFYGEPSYTSWIVLSLLAIILGRKDSGTKTALSAIVLSFLIVSVSLSIAGVLAVFIFSAFWYFSRIRNSQLFVPKLLIGLVLILVTGGFMVNDNGEIGQRLRAIVESDDASASNRLEDPLIHINEIVEKNRWLGLKYYEELRINNAGLGLVIHYGILAIPILAILLFHTKRPLLILYLLLSLNFNGTFFRFDKTLVVGAVLGLACVTAGKTKTNYYE